MADPRYYMAQSPWIGITREFVMGLLGRHLCLFFAALMLAASGDVWAASASLSSHRAIYQMIFKSASQGSDIAELNGQMLIEVVDVCDGWTLEQRIALTIINFEGREVHSYTSFTSWESKDGLRFRFEQKTQQNDVTVEELGGEAAMAPDGGGLVRLAKPTEASLELASGTLFPSRHTELLIASAEAGVTFVSRVVYDGTSPEGPSQISAFISAPKMVPGLAGEFAEARAWPVHLAFYPASSLDSEPEVEIGMMLQANGVARSMTIDYGTFTIEGRLDKLELLPATDC